MRQQPNTDRQGVSGLGAVLNLPVLPPLSLRPRTHCCLRYRDSIPEWDDLLVISLSSCQRFTLKLCFCTAVLILMRMVPFQPDRLWSLIVIDWQTKLFKKTFLTERLLGHFCKFESLPYNCLFPCHRIQTKQNM